MNRFYSSCWIIVPLICGCYSKHETRDVGTTDPPATVNHTLTLPEFTLTDQSAQPFGSRDLSGKVAVVNFMFTRCPVTCPTQSTKLAELQTRLEHRAGWKDVRLISVSVEPEIDTPEVLAEYAKRYGADTDHWKFLTGPREVIWNLSKEGFHLPVMENGREAGSLITHSPKFILVASDGEIVGYFDSTSADEWLKLSDQLDRLVPQEDSGSGLSDTRKRRYVPNGVEQPDWVEQRRADQLASTDQIDVFWNYSYRDKIQESGITFLNRVVDDAAKDYKPAHYDHGNGIAVADVDGDGLLDIYFVTQVGPNQLWRNLGDGRFENITASAGLGLGDRISVTATFADIDNDGDADLYVTNVRSPNALFLNNGRAQFDDATESSGLGYDGHSSGATFFDCDRDGDLDLYLSVVGRYTTDKRVSVRGTVPEEQLDGPPPEYYVAYVDAFAGHLHADRAESSRLYLNNGDGRFTDATEAMGLVDDLWNGDATPIDANDDGWPDLYVLNMQGHDRLYLNRAGKKFESAAGEIFGKTPWGTMGAKVFDVDNDGQLDLYLTDMHSDMSADISVDKEKLKAAWMPDNWSEKILRSEGRSIFGNALFRKLAAGEYEEVSDEYNAENYWPWGLSVGDLNADGYQDVFVCSSMNFPYRYGVNSLLLNNRGRRFVDAEYILGIEPRREGRIVKPWFQVDCDSNEDQGHRACRNQSGKIVICGALGTRSAAIADFDEDGDLDIVTNEFGDNPMLLVSDLTEAKKDMKFLKIKLVGTQSNRDGLGARVILTADGQSYHQVHDGKSGYLSQSSLPLYFGISQAQTVDAVDVQWPSGKKQRIDGPIDTNQTITITEP